MVGGRGARYARGMLPPRRVTCEHEAAHAVAARAGCCTVNFIDLQPQPTNSTISLARLEWKPDSTDGNAVVVAWLAGPVQTAITVERLKLASLYARAAIEQEARDIEAFLRSRGNNPKPGAARGMIETHFDRMRSYLLSQPVQTAIQTLADALEAADMAGTNRLTWDALEPLVSWDLLPPPPRLDHAQRKSKLE